MCTITLETRQSIFGELDIYGAEVIRTRRGHPSLSLLQFDGAHPGIQTEVQSGFIDEDGFESCSEHDGYGSCDELPDHVSRETQPDFPPELMSSSDYETIDGDREVQGFFSKSCLRRLSSRKQKTVRKMYREVQCRNAKIQEAVTGQYTRRKRNPRGRTLL